MTPTIVLQDKATEGSSGRKRIPIPVPDFAKGGQNGRQSQGHSQQPPRQHKVDASLQLERARFRAHMTKKLQETKAAHANGLDHMRRSQVCVSSGTTSPDSCCELW